MSMEFDDPWLASVSAELRVRQIRRSAVRALRAELPSDWNVAALREGFQRLAQFAAKRHLRVVEPPLFVLHGNPVLDDESARSWHLLLPVLGKVTADALDEGMSVDTTEGGAFVQATTASGLPGLERLYDFLFHRYLPRYKHVMTRPRIFHRAPDGLDGNDPRKLTVTAIVPVTLSLVRGELGPSVTAAAS